jgi:hypothetical protein
MPEAWESERGGEESWSEREAWRGDLYAEDADAWRKLDEMVDGWEIEEEEECEEPEPELGWPENLAGPEYWLFKRDCDD